MPAGRMTAHSWSLTGCRASRYVLVPSVRPGVREHALRAGAREARDGTTLGTLTHGEAVVADVFMA